MLGSESKSDDNVSNDENIQTTRQKTTGGQMVQTPVTPEPQVDLIIFDDEEDDAQPLTLMPTTGATAGTEVSKVERLINWQLWNLSSAL